MSESVENITETTESWERGPTAASARSRPTRACGKCGRKYLVTHVAAHEGGCTAAAPAVVADGTKPKKKARAKAAKK
jgi:hypothetical protein